jgi:hypothetical protein
MLVDPSLGRRVAERYIRSWQMEPLPAQQRLSLHAGIGWAEVLP